MKALSLKQPWAELVVSGQKTIEIRKWNTHFRGEFLVHASKNGNKEATARFGLQNLPEGCIVGKATLVSVKKYQSQEEFEADAGKHFAKGWWDPKAHGFILQNAQRLEPKPLKGMLNFFEVKESSPFT
ncbi:ASCH domain-containing protein [Candidatus Woesearchaeota archaeon]|nr:ASCH domain-containing protein [Candidatus Woesearchaeota archaeon]